MTLATLDAVAAYVFFFLVLITGVYVVINLCFRSYRRRSNPYAEGSPSLTIKTADGFIILDAPISMLRNMRAFNDDEGVGCVICGSSLGSDTVVILSPPHTEGHAILAHPHCMNGLRSEVTP